MDCGPPAPTPTLAATPTPTPTRVPPPSVRRCRVTLTLVSIQVLNDTEVGSEEWIVTTHTILPVRFDPFRLDRVSADVGEGDVQINSIFESVELPESAFPTFAIIVAIVKEDDPGRRAYPLGLAEPYNPRMARTR